MATIIGVVDCINVGDDFGFARIVENGTGEIENVIMWFSPANPSAFSRVMHSIWVSMLRDSLNNGRTVTVVTASGGANITNVRLHR